MNAAEIETAFARTIADAGLGDALIPADGKLHRFRVSKDRANQRTGWAVLHPDGVPHGTAGDWRTGARVTWRPDGVAATEADRRDLAENRRQRQAERQETQKRAATKAAALFERLPAAPTDHPYLARKQVPAGPSRVTVNGALVVPVTDAATGEIISLQFIRPDGSKRFLAGGRTAGGCCVLDATADGKMVISEGYATTQSTRRWPISSVRSHTNKRPLLRTVS